MQKATLAIGDGASTDEILGSASDRRTLRGMIASKVGPRLGRPIRA
jgi:hypothetical protein